MAGITADEGIKSILKVWYKDWHWLIYRIEDSNRLIGGKKSGVVGIGFDK